MKVQGKIELLRKEMSEQGVQACIIPTTDPHISEYTPSHWKTRAWLTGFTGSAGTAVITAEKAGLWTDSRYFIQAEEQLKGSGITLFKMGLPDTPTISQWLTDNLNESDTIGIEGEVFDASEALSMLGLFDNHQLRLNAAFAPWNTLWGERPPVPEDPIFVLPEELTGQSVASKLQQIISDIKKEGADATVLASLDMIAWLFNIRGTDIEYNPVAVAYAYVSERETVLFINPKKLTEEAINVLQSQGVRLADYDKIFDYISSLPKETKVLLTPAKINYKLYKAIEKTCAVKAVNLHPVDCLKGIKNEAELTGIRNAMKKDGVAMVRFLIWLEESLASGSTITEMDVAETLRRYRSEQALFFSESFSTIAGYNAHGAIVHYEADEESNAVIHPSGMLLVDSGAQYFDGTTDITRTIAVGPVSEMMKRDYTHILKGNIQLSKVSFPQGTVGMQLDVLARQFIWKEGQNYLHGTGHGVGCFLNVHEGPQSIRMNYNPIPLEPGMITSNEPGLYRAGEYGIRIENLILTVKDKTTAWGEYYAFETLTLCPIDTALIDKSLMNDDEIRWLNQYHQQVYLSLSPLLSEAEQAWLKAKTESI